MWCSCASHLVLPPQTAQLKAWGSNTGRHCWVSGTLIRWVRSRLDSIGGCNGVILFSQARQNPNRCCFALLQDKNRWLSVSCFDIWPGAIKSEFSISGRLESNSARSESLTLSVTTGKVEGTNLKFEMWPTPVFPRWSWYEIAVPLRSITR